MNSLLYAKLAKTNLSKNRQNILPYWLSCIGTVIMFYIMSTLSLSEGLKKMMGEATIQIVMQFGVYIIGLFAVIFLIYSNSFLAKRRKKEFGLFQILGMEKKHLAKVLFFESLYLWILSVGGGILLGILGYKDGWTISSNKEAGDGFSDIVIVIDDSDTGIIIEVKYAEESQMTQESEKALEQMKRKNYTAVFQNTDVRHVLKYGIACSRKKCRVVGEKEEL